MDELQVHVHQNSRHIPTFNENRSHLTGICSTCQKIANAVDATKPHQRLSLSLGTWQGFLERKECVCCQKIVRCLMAAPETYHQFKQSCPLQLTDMTDCYWIRCDSLLDPCTGGKKFDSHPKLQVIHQESQRRYHLRYIPVDSSKIDLARLATWSACCDRNHQGSCHDLPHWQIIPPALSLIFVDVQNFCLAQTSGRVSSKYVALSYVWGQITESLELRSENLSLLCAQGSLKETCFISRIPKTILDAMTVTRQMGLRYLWVDRLCIIQDTPTHMTMQLQQMASIYANSYFTIIAADGFDAEHGLRGVNPHHSARLDSNESFNFARTVKMTLKPQRESFYSRPFWHTRGWTFQERALSRRNLVFTNNTMYWECRSATWYENVQAEPEGAHSQIPPQPASSSWPSYALNINPWPDLNQYFNLVTGYNARNLKFKNDALNAFAAIITAMSKSFPGGFHFGLPVFLFDMGMLWSTHDSSKRRSDFPSWSWLGCNGEVHLGSYSHAWRPILGYGHDSIRMQPLVRWYAIHKDGISRQLIDNSYHLHKVDIREPSVTTTDGWHKTWSETYKKDAVQHDSLPSFLFKYPFPLFPAAKADSSYSFSCFLEFEAEACMLFLGASNLTSPVLRQSRQVDLFDGLGRWVGVIEPTYVREEQYEGGIPCDLIAISEGWTTRFEDHESEPDFIQHQPFEEMERVQEIKVLEEYHFYNVLWIDRIGGVAYRNGMGRVWKGAWTQQNTKIEKIVLG